VFEFIFLSRYEILDTIYEQQNCVVHRAKGKKERKKEDEKTKVITFYVTNEIK